MLKASIYKCCSHGRIRKTFPLPCIPKTFNLLSDTLVFGNIFLPDNIL